MNENISIKTFGYLRNQEVGDICRTTDGLLLIVSITDDMQIFIGQRWIQLRKHHALITKLGVQGISEIRGQAVFAVLIGRLILQYIGDEKIGVVIPFSASDSLVGRVHQLQGALDFGKYLDGKTLTELGFGLLLDIYEYEIFKKRIPKAVSCAIAIIDNEYGRLYGVEDLAVRVGVSKSHLIRQFQASMQITPGVYLEEVRLQNAKTLLKYANLDIQMVANLCGYSCANYFSKVFKKKFRVCPSEYSRNVARTVNTQLFDEFTP